MLFFELIQVAVGNLHMLSSAIPSNEDWQKIMSLSERQGLMGLCFSGIERLPKQQRPCMEVLMAWFGQTECMTAAYAVHEKAIQDLASFYSLHGIRLMVLKGYGLSKYWPVPNRRPVGDVDIYNFGLWEYADQIVHDKLGVMIDNSHHHHTVFKFHGIYVENHYDFINVYAHSSSPRIEARLKKLVKKENIKSDIPNLFFPNADFNALFLILHAAAHFSSTELTMRQLLDWSLFVKAEHDNVDWIGLYSFLRDVNLHRFANCMNAISVRYLGFESSMFPEIEIDDALVERVLNDIMSPEFAEKEDGSLVSGLRIKPRRWWHNRWKRKICFDDSNIDSFLHLLYAKILKPSHFRQ